MNEQKVRGLMGLSVKAGQAVFGQDGCLKNIRGGTCSLLLVEETASENTKDMYERACRVNGTRLCYLPGGMLLAATGRPGVAMALKEGAWLSSCGSCCLRIIRTNLGSRTGCRGCKRRMTKLNLKDATRELAEDAGLATE